MIQKKWLLSLLLVVMAQLTAQAQIDWGWSWKDSAVIANKKMPQRAEFLANEFPYPPKPRSMWEIGISLGNSRIIGDVANFKFGYGVGITARKALSNVVSLRGGILYQQTVGINPILSTNTPTDGFLTGTTPYRAITGYGDYAKYAPANTNKALRAFAANYKNNSYTGTLDVIISTNTLSYYRGNPKWDIYLFGGYALVAANVTTRLTGSDSTSPFDFSALNYNGTKASIQNDVNAALNAASSPDNVAPLKNRRRDLGTGDMILTHAFSFGAGVSYKINDKINVGFENRFINTLNGDMDGLHTGRNDYFSYASARIHINLGSKSRKVQPLYWLNPNNYVYNEINAPRHMKLAKPVLADADKDGVTDQFDLEPNTPLGAPVDSHGVSKDTDGDGVPDYKDKELLTPQQCFPVNTDGVGNCPDPACCKELKDLITNNKMPQPAVSTECSIGNLLSLPFRGNARLTKEAQQLLADAAVTIKANPACKIKVIGYGSASKSSQQLSWERVNAVVKYLVEKQGISESRLLFVYAQDGDAAMVDLQGTTEEGPNTVPAPHPNLKSKN